MPLNNKISFIGSGRMAEAIIQGIIRAGLFSPENIYISDKDPQRLISLAEKYKVNAVDGNIKAATSAGIVVLSVKPQVMSDVLDQIKSHIKENQIFISIAAGISLSFLETKLPSAGVIRVMPNNPCLVGEGMSVLSKGAAARDADLKIAEGIFSSLGKTLILEEKYLNAVTGLSGSGPAFVYRVIEALAQGGEKAGLSKDVSGTLALQTVLGAVKTVIETAKSPKELCDMVASPGGTTLEGLKILDAADFNRILSDAVCAAADRAKELESPPKAGQA